MNRSVVVLVLCLIGVCVAADAYTDESKETVDAIIANGLSAIDNGRVTAGVIKLQTAVELRNPRAMMLLAELYREGKGEIEPDSDKSFSLMREAAQMGYPAAMLKLASFYVDGVGTSPDLVKAKYWANRAGEMGSAKVNLLKARRAYASKDGKTAINLIGQIKEMDDDEFIEANLLLGSIYLEGRGIPVNESLGIASYEKCIARNSKQAMWELGRVYCEGKTVARNYDKGISLVKQSMTNATKKDSEEYWYKYIVLGNAYLDPAWEEFDLGKGIECLENAIELSRGIRDQSIRHELYVLGRIYAFEDRSLGRFARGVGLLKRAEKCHDNDASYYLAVLYFNGDGVERDLYKAENYASYARFSDSSRIKDAAEALYKAINAIEYKSF